MIKTVRVKKDNGRTGYCIINESDFNPDKHELFDAPALDDKADAPKRGRKPKAVDYELQS
jgi:hypothetical protein